MNQEENCQKVYNKTWKTSGLILSFHQLGNVPAGEIFNMHIPCGIPFQGIGDLMLKMNRIYDLLDYPQQEYKIREWDDKGSWKGTILESDRNWNYEEDALEKFRVLGTGRYPFVYVETRFRRYGGWQGIMQAGKKKLTYRSSLEFLHYIMGYVNEM